MMEIHISRRGRPSRRSTRLAFRSVVTSAAAMVAAYIVQTRALTTISQRGGDWGHRMPAALSWLASLHDWLMYLPLPGLILGFAAIVMRRFRPILSPLAALATFAAVAVLVATLVTALVPMYHLPEELFQQR